MSAALEDDDRRRLETRFEILEALQQAVDDPAVLVAIDGAQDRAHARALLHAQPVRFTADQAEAVLSLTLGRRTAFARLERQDEMANIRRQLGWD